MNVHSCLLRVGLTKPTVEDVLEKIIKNKISKDKLDILYSENFNIRSSILIKKGDDDLVSYLMYDYDKIKLKFRHEYNDYGYFVPVDCQFIIKHLDEINNILIDIESKIESKYNEKLNRRFEINAKREQENKCLTKLWKQF